MKMTMAGKVRVLLGGDLRTPAFVYDEQCLLRRIREIRRATSRARCRLLYSIKALSLPQCLEVIGPAVDGFAASSLFEATLAREVTRSRGSVHFSSPGLRQDDAPHIASCIDTISFNSLSQWRRFGDKFVAPHSCGLRVNPEISFVDDDRYDPCRQDSKLGVPISQLRTLASENAELLQGVDGIHVHNNCDSRDFSQLLRTVECVESDLAPMMRGLKWLNLGGGYLFDAHSSSDVVWAALRGLQSRCGLDVYIEPGAAIVRSAGYIVSTVIDVIEGSSQAVVVLDTTVGHAPEFFEYQDYCPLVVGSDPDGDYQCVLVGCSCLAGDVFGEYRFAEPLQIGSRVVFADVGAYTTVKWNTFNGISLPSIYALTAEDALELVSTHSYEDFTRRCGALRC